MSRYYLYRVVLIETSQLPLFGADAREKVLHDAVHEKPSAGTRGQVQWHVGNVEDFDSKAIFFRIGKTGPAIESIFDESTADFVDTESEEAPYTSAVIELQYQVCAIATNAKLAPAAKSIAARLQKLLSRTKSVRNSRYRIEINEIQNPEHFVDAIRRAYAVYRFSVGFGLPNPIDPEKDFEEPMQGLLAKLGGKRGITTVTAPEDLDREAMADLARAAAARGNRASAKIKRTSRASAEQRKMEGTPASTEVESIPGTSKERREFVKGIIAAYMAIRKGDQTSRDE